MTERILITGAAGFVGRELVRALHDDGLPVVAASRRALEDAKGIEVFRMPDLAGEIDWSGALDGVGAVVHLAARVHVMKDSAQDSAALYTRVNSLATARLAEQAARAGVRRFVFLSSVKVHGESNAAGPFTESSPTEPRYPYGTSKLEAERALAEVAARTGMTSIILRPPLVYGPGVRGNFLSLLRWVDRGLPLPLGAIENRRNLIYLGNLVSAIRRGLDAQAEGCQAFLLRDGEDLSTPELVRRLARALGRPARLPKVPVWLLAAGATAMGRKAAMEKVSASLTVDDGLIRKDLGWTPPFSVDHGLAETAAWYRVNSPL